MDHKPGIVANYEKMFLGLNLSSILAALSSLFACGWKMNFWCDARCCCCINYTSLSFCQQQRERVENWIFVCGSCGVGVRPFWFVAAGKWSHPRAFSVFLLSAQGWLAMEWVEAAVGTCGFGSPRPVKFAESVMVSTECTHKSILTHLEIFISDYIIWLCISRCIKFSKAWNDFPNLINNSMRRNQSFVY